MNYVILIKLLVAHFLADFVLQTDYICSGKKGERKSGSPFSNKFTKYLIHILHSAIHAGVSYVLVAEWNNWIVPSVIFTTHLIIDLIKYKSKDSSLNGFIIDQIIHLFIILILWGVLYGDSSSISQWWCKTYLRNLNIWVIFIGYLILLKPTSVLLGRFISRWTPDESSEQSLPNAGKWIGYLERILILTFIITDNIGGIGFLLAAKSIFRFGDLSKAKDIKITEYVLIGTLTSFTIAIMVGLLLNLFLDTQ